MAEPETGATAEQAATETKAGQEGMRVMVAIDESDGSLYALSWTLDHFMVASSSTPAGPRSLIVFHAQQPFQQFVLPAGPGVYVSASVTDSMIKTREENTAHVLARAIRLCQERNVIAETLVMDGEPKEMICQAVQQKVVDLVVVGSRGLGKFKRAFLGSVSDYVAHHAKCPVLIVKPPKEDH